MTTHQKVIFCLCFAVTIFQSCSETTSTDQEGGQAVTEQVQAVEETSEYLMTSVEFYGIKKDQKITEEFEKSVLQTGEGDFDIFLIKDEDGSQLGYIHPGFEDESLVGYMVATSPKVTTSHGLSIGMTFGELQEKYPNAEVHGSEIEGYTSANVDEIYYTLDFNHWSYDLDANIIPKDTKIKEISN